MLILAPLVVVASWWMTGRLRRYALARQVVDVPNARSSHSAPTPRGGGMAIVVTTLASMIVFGASGRLAWPDVIGLAGAGAFVAVVGFVDDHRHIPAPWRLLAHVAAAAWLLRWLDWSSPAPVRATLVTMLWPVVDALYVVWVLNLTNFMDGIDGIAAVEAITVSAFGATLGWLAGVSGAPVAVPVLLAAGALGFVIWNWPPARIFMGDAGSGFVGLMLAAVSLSAGREHGTLFSAWVILLGVFVTDATVTLLRRALRGDRIHQAHRTHAYQHAAIRYGAHKPVTIAVAVVNICWLFPLAALVAFGVLDATVGLAIAYAPLIVAALWLNAGVPEQPVRMQPSATS
jgi:Fuc2NAc and GlcNAc transferase